MQLLRLLIPFSKSTRISMDIKLSNFNSVYELFAGVSSALAGLHFVRKYIICYLQPYIKNQSEKMQERIENLDFKLRILMGTEESIGINPVKENIDISRREYNRLKVLVSERHELNVINSKFEALLWLNFLYCCFTLVIGGLADSKFFEQESTPFILVSNISLFAILLIIGNLKFAKSYECSNWYTGIFFAGISLILSIIWQVAFGENQIPLIGGHGFTFWNPLWTVSITLFIIVCPFIILALRVPTFIYHVCPTVEKMATLTDKVTRNTFESMEGQ